MRKNLFQHPVVRLVRAKRMVKRLLSGVAAMLLLPASAVVVHDAAGPGMAAEAAAALLSQPGYSATGWIEVHEGSARFRGTGVLLQNNWVLTAAHNGDPARLTGLTFHHGGIAHPALGDSWIQHPGWTTDPAVGLGQGWDLALFRLAAPVAGTAPASLYAGTSELGALVTFLGAGSAGTGSTGPHLNATPLFYAGTNTIDRVIALDGAHGRGGLLAFDFDDGTDARNTLAGSTVYDVSGQSHTSLPGATILSQASSLEVTLLEGTSALGDSGGPVFANFGQGPELVGLLSWGVNPSEPSRLYSSLYGDIAYLTRVSASRDWVMAVIPEPAHGALLVALVILPGVVCRRVGFRRCLALLTPSNAGRKRPATTVPPSPECHEKHGP